MKWLESVMSLLLIKDDKKSSEEVYCYDYPLKRTKSTKEFAKVISPFINEFLSEIATSYHVCFGEKSSLRGQKAIMPSAAMCVIYKEEYHSNALFESAFDELMSRAKKLGYYLTYSTVKVEESLSAKKETEVYYLKARPSEALDGYKLNQLWGQLFIEHHLVDEETCFIKIRCNYYSGHNYSEPLPFDDLIERLCQASPCHTD